MDNRFNYHLRGKKEIDNKPVKRPWELFLRMKYIGGEDVNYNTIKVEKTDQNFYPSRQLLSYNYRKLAADPQT